ncbi:MAG TPA: PP2C family protein-serine/threonine phosphatase [Anaerolineales bacterium]|nr:PP2C family protein-serine/threonine phosphatase [Anaerolineales bacterium]
MSNTHTHQALDTIHKGLSETRENIYHWLEGTPEEKQGIQLGSPDECCVEDHLEVINECLEKAEDGTLGICEICHEPVDDELLTMDYTATICLGHYTEEELRQLESELEMSQIVQRALLPQQAPNIPGINVAAFSRPAQIVSGDYFDFVPFHDGGHGFVMADVSGHGVSAGMLMSSLQTAFHTLIPAAESPLDVLERINHLYAHNINFTTFVTIFFGKLDPVTRLFTYANAGHNSAYLLRGDGQEEVLLHPTGPAIGLMEGFRVHAEQVQLNSGDTLVLYTDGVTEAMNRDGVQLGIDRLADIVRGSAHLAAEQIVQSIWKAVNAFTDGIQPVDDTTMVVCKVQ